MTDLDDTARCPVGARCEACGTASRPLGVATASTPLGVLCMTTCVPCGRRMTAGLAAATAAKLVLAHCEHLGIDADEMAAALRREVR